MWSVFFCAFDITRDMKNFVQISTILVLYFKIESWTKFLISLVISTALKRQTTFWKCQDLEILWWLFQESYMFKYVDDWMSQTNSKFKAIVMFRGTPCTRYCTRLILRLNLMYVCHNKVKCLEYIYLKLCFYETFLALI